MAERRQARQTGLSRGRAVGPGRLALARSIAMLQKVAFRYLTCEPGFMGLFRLFGHVLVHFGQLLILLRGLTGELSKILAVFRRPTGHGLLHWGRIRRLGVDRRQFIVLLGFSQHALGLIREVGCDAIVLVGSLGACDRSLEFLTCERCFGFYRSDCRTP